MAKKKVVDETENSGSIFDKMIEEEFSEMEDLSKVDDSVNYWIDTGNWALNYAISKKFRAGYPGGRITNFAGLSGVGKSLFPASASKAKVWGNPDKYIFDRTIVVDSEGGGTGKNLFSFIDAPLDRVRYTTIQTLDSFKIRRKDNKTEAVADKDIPAKLLTEEYEYKRGLIAFLKQIVQKMVYNHSKEKLLFIVDSISNIKSYRTAIENGEDMGKTNKLLNNFFALDTDLHDIDATVFLASKVYTNLNNPYDPWVISGGQAIAYNPSLTLMMSAMSDSEDLTEAEVKAEKARRKTALGNSVKPVRINIKKSRFGTEGRNVTIMLDATYGIIRNSGLFQMLYEMGAIKKNGTMYTIPGVIEKSFYKKDFAKIFSEHEDEYIDKLQVVMDAIEEDIKNKRRNLNVSDMSEIEDDPTNEPEEVSSDIVETTIGEMIATMDAETGDA